MAKRRFVPDTDLWDSKRVRLGPSDDDGSGGNNPHDDGSGGNGGNNPHDGSGGRSHLAGPDQGPDQVPEWPPTDPEPGARTRSRARTRSLRGLRRIPRFPRFPSPDQAQINKGKGNDKPVDRPVRCPDPEPCDMHAALAAAAAQSCGGQSAEQTSDVSQLAGDSAPNTGGTLFGTSLFTFLPDDAVPCFSQAKNAEVWQQYTVPHDLHERLPDIAGALSWHNALSQLLQRVGHPEPPRYFSASIDASLRLELLTLRQAKWLRHLNARANSAKHNLCFSV